MIRAIGSPGGPPAAARAPAGARGGFAGALAGALEPPQGVRLSAHAQQRMAERRIGLSPREWARVGDALDRMAAKGARASLLLMDRVALVVSVPQRTVITAVPREDADVLFTQIDSAAVLPGDTAETGIATGPDPMPGGPRAAERPTRRINERN